MGIVGVAGAVLLSAMLVLLLREMRPVMALSLRLTVLVLLFAAALRLFVPVVERVRELLTLAGSADYADLALGALGVALISEFGAAFCRDLGEPGLGDGLLFFGRLEILLLALPLVDSLLAIARELLMG